MHFIFVGNAKQSLSQLKPEVKRVKARLISQLVKIATSFLATPGIRENQTYQRQDKQNYDLPV